MSKGSLGKVVRMCPIEFSPNEHALNHSLYKKKSYQTVDLVKGNC